MAFFGTPCVAGHGRGIVGHTGDRTVMGQIAHLSTPLGYMEDEEEEEEEEEEDADEQ